MSNVHNLSTMIELTEKRLAITKAINKKFPDAQCIVTPGGEDRYESAELSKSEDKKVEWFINENRTISLRHYADVKVKNQGTIRVYGKQTYMANMSKVVEYLNGAKIKGLPESMVVNVIPLPTAPVRRVVGAF